MAIQFTQVPFVQLLNIFASELAKTLRGEDPERNNYFKILINIINQCGPNTSVELIKDIAEASMVAPSPSLLTQKEKVDKMLSDLELTTRYPRKVEPNDR